MADSDRYVVISTDGHCGADVYDYRPYLEQAFHEEFDAWAGSYRDGWADVDVQPEGERRIGAASAVDPLNWDGAARWEALESEGIVAEVLFPNTAPPFYPSNAVSAPGPRTAEEYVRRFAGIRAHNRWLADFCDETSGRRAGIAQVFLNDVEDAVREVHRAKASGLAGVLLPADHVLGLSNLYYPTLDPFWAACVDLDMPVHRHGGIVAEAASPDTGPGAPAIGIFESMYFAQRGLAHLILGGVFERFPTLKFVITEINSAWAPDYLETLDAFGRDAEVPGTKPHMFARAAFDQLSMSPTEYCQRNCYFASFMTRADVGGRDRLGSGRLMWAADFPHHEGTWPWSRQALRLNFAEVPEDEVRSLLSETAAQCYGFDLDVLQPLADRIGPTVAEVATPLRPEEMPRVPDESVCVTFTEDPDWRLAG